MWTERKSLNGVAWENSRHFTTSPLVSPQNDVWEMSAEIPYWWRVTTQNWVVLLIGRAAWEICLTRCWRGVDEVSEQIFSRSKIPLASYQRNLDLNHPDLLWISFACVPFHGFETSYLLLFNKWKSRSLQVELEFIIKDKVLLSFSWTQKWPVGFKHVNDALNHSSAILKIPITSGYALSHHFKKASKLRSVLCWSADYHHS